MVYPEINDMFKRFWNQFSLHLFSVFLTVRSLSCMESAYKIITYNYLGPVVHGSLKVHVDQL